MRKRLISFLMAVILCFTLATVAFAQTGATTLRVESPQTAAVGETFSVTVSLEGNPGITAAQFTVRFDQNVLECSDIKLGSVLNGTLSAKNPSAADGAIVAAASASPVQGDGVLATLTFRVLKAGDPALAMEDVLLADARGAEISTSVSGLDVLSKPEPTTGEPVKPNDPTTKSENEKTASDDKSGSPSQTPAFRDVPASHWAFSYVQRAAKLGLFAGYDDGGFHPNDAMTRAQFVTLLWRLAGQPEPAGTASFADVAPGSWYEKQALWGAENGYVMGVNDTDFAPNVPLSREQAVTILFRYSGGIRGAETLLTGVYDSQFTDSGSIGSYAKDAMYWAIYNGIVTGTTATTVAPRATASRVQIAVIFLRYMDQILGGVA